MKFLRPITAVAILILLPLSWAKAQNNTADTGYSPYSIFGIGDLAKSGSAYNASMGGIGIGDRNIRYINYLNPAAVTARQTKSFMMDFGVRQNNVYYAARPAGSENTLHSANNVFNMDHIVLSFPIWKSSAFKFGITPYSSTGYRFRTKEGRDELISEMGDIEYYQLGQGGVSKAFFGAGATFFKRLSIGVDGEYLFGNITRYTAASFNTSSSYRSINSGWNYTLHGLGAKFGLQYEQPLGKKLVATVGATYSLASKVGGEVNRFAYGVHGSSSDTIVNTTTKLDGYEIPAELGVGFTLRAKDESWMFGFDYTDQDWTRSVIDAAPGTGFSPARTRAFRGGFEFTPNRYDMRYFLKHITYRAGAYHELSYYSFNGYQVAATGITLGFSIPVFRYFNSVNFALDLGQRGSLTDNLVRERYFKFTVSFALHDIWFLKPMYE